MTRDWSRYKAKQTNYDTKLQEKKIGKKETYEQILSNSKCPILIILRNQAMV